MKILDTFNRFSPTLISRDELSNHDLSAGISTARFVFCGEIHGAKQNCDVLYSLVTHYGITSLAIEVHEDLKPFVDTCIANHPDFSLIESNYFIGGVLSVEMAKTIAVLFSEAKLKHIHYINADSEKDMAGKILGVKDPGPTIVLMGNWHTTTKLMDQGKHKSAYLFVSEAAKGNAINIEYMYLTGSIYNYGNGIMSFGNKSLSTKYAIATIGDGLFELTVPVATPIFHDFS